MWDAPVVGWPGCRTFGLNASRGLYARLQTCTPRNAGGFTVFRPAHGAYWDWRSLTHTRAHSLF